MMMMMLPKDLIWEILKRLPLKSLMRCKRVSQTWLRIINDPWLALTYSGGSPGLICAKPNDEYPISPPPYSHTLIGVSLEVEGGGGGGGSCCSTPTNKTTMVIHYEVVHGDKPQDMKQCTNVVKGLLCFYRGNYSWLHNVTTGETVELPPASSSPTHNDHVVDDDDDEEEEEIRNRHVYHLGFEYVRRRYKLLRICQHAAEILTIGVDSRWRRIIISGILPWVVGEASACLGESCWLIENNPLGLSGSKVLAQRTLWVQVMDSLGDELKMNGMREFKEEERTLLLCSIRNSFIYLNFFACLQMEE